MYRTTDIESQASGHQLAGGKCSEMIEKQNGNNGEAKNQSNNEGNSDGDSDGDEECNDVDLSGSDEEQGGRQSVPTVEYCKPSILIALT